MTNSLINGDANSISISNTNVITKNNISQNIPDITSNTNNILTNTTKLSNISYDTNHEKTATAGDSILDDVVIDNSFKSS